MESGQRAVSARRQVLGRLVADAVDLVEDDQARNVPGADVRQHLGGDLQLALEVRVGGVDDVRQQTGLQRLVERALE